MAGDATEDATPGRRVRRHLSGGLSAPLPNGTSLTSLTGLRSTSQDSLSRRWLGRSGSPQGLDARDLNPASATPARGTDEEPHGVTGAEPGLATEAFDEENEVSNYCMRVFVFAAFSLGVQGFMSYSGGATPASLPAIQAANPGMSQVELSLLGSLDKIGQVVASPLWGRALQRAPTKVLLVCGLFLNSLFSLQFGFVQSKYWMFLSKFMQGCTESQQVVWGNLWTTFWAPRHLLSSWMNLGGVAAGVGTALGQAVAGFGITAGMPYCFAYAVQAAALAFLWVGLVFTPARYISLPSGILLEASQGSIVASSSASAKSAPTVRQQLGVLLRRRLYWLTMLSVAENNFIVGGLQFFWTRFFCNGPWTLDLGTVTAAGLLVQGVGMGLGIFLGPMIVNRYGGYHDDLGRYVTLHLLMRISAVATFGAGLAVLSMAIQLSAWHEGAELLDSSLLNPWLWVFWFATVPINFALSAQGGVQTVINIGSVPAGMQELAQGVTTSVQFLFGYAGGVILPSVILDIAFRVNLALTGYKMSEGDQLATGVLVLMMMCPVLFCTVGLACNEAKRIWEKSLVSAEDTCGSSSESGDGSGDVE